MASDWTQPLIYFNYLQLLSACPMNWKIMSDHKFLLLP